jgi:hypothetical protein
MLYASWRQAPNPGFEKSFAFSGESGILYPDYRSPQPECPVTCLPGESTPAVLLTNGETAYN